MFDYDAERLKSAVLEITRSSISSESWDWLQERLQHQDRNAVYTAFALIPRKVGKAEVSVTPEQTQLLSSIKPGIKPENWSVDRLTRTCLLLHLDTADQAVYSHIIENLFRAGEMTELAALYGALPFFAYPESWRARCAEGIRSNIGLVLESIMYENPYPAKHLESGAWNQLVMKAIFTDKDVTRIYGLESRSNPELSLILSDYAHERWAAGRTVNPLLWRIAGFHPSERILADLRKVEAEGSAEEKVEAERILASIK